ncbi:MAG: polysaccharide deacetylase family protein [Phycisphaerales bacterium]|nr:polysaccharide deacetylase family protein [Phycisphaerales bacterium]
MPDPAQVFIDGGHLVATYHYVRPKNSDGVTGVTPAEFRRQIRWLAKNYRIVGVDEFASRGPDDGSMALITFDDAVKDQWRFAAPVLDELGVPAAFFAPMRPVSDEADGWCTQHLLHALAQHLGFKELEQRVDAALEVRGIVPSVDVVEMDRLYHYEVARKRRLKYLMAFVLDQAAAHAVLTEINAGVGMDHRDWFMSAEELSALQSAGHTLGGHGFDHLAYTTLDEAGQDRDMARAQEWMTRLFGKRARPIAFPFGRADETTYRLLAKHGYTTAFTTGNRVDAKDVGRLAIGAVSIKEAA